MSEIQQDGSKPERGPELWLLRCGRVAEVAIVVHCLGCNSRGTFARSAQLDHMEVIVCPKCGKVLVEMLDLNDDMLLDDEDAKEPDHATPDV